MNKGAFQLLLCVKAHFVCLCHKSITGDTTSTSIRSAVFLSRDEPGAGAPGGAAIGVTAHDRRGRAQARAHTPRAARRTSEHGRGGVRVSLPRDTCAHETCRSSPWAQRPLRLPCHTFDNILAESRVCASQPAHIATRAYIPRRGVNSNQTKCASVSINIYWLASARRARALAGSLIHRCPRLLLWVSPRPRRRRTISRPSRLRCRCCSSSCS